MKLALSHQTDDAVSVIIQSPLQVALVAVFAGESTWLEGTILIALYASIAASFWWG